MRKVDDKGDMIVRLSTTQLPSGSEESQCPVSVGAIKYRSARNLALNGSIMTAMTPKTHCGGLR